MQKFADDESIAGNRPAAAAAENLEFLAGFGEMFRRKLGPFIKSRNFVWYAPDTWAMLSIYWDLRTLETCSVVETQSYSRSLSQLLAVVSAQLASPENWENK